MDWYLIKQPATLDLLDSINNPRSSSQLGAVDSVRQVSLFPKKTRRSMARRPSFVICNLSIHFILPCIISFLALHSWRYTPSPGRPPKNLLHIGCEFCLREHWGTRNLVGSILFQVWRFLQITILWLAVIQLKSREQCRYLNTRDIYLFKWSCWDFWVCGEIGLMDWW